MINNIKLFLNNVELKNYSLMLLCIKISTVISLFGFFIVYLLHENPFSLHILYLGIKLLYLGVFYSIFSIICGLCMDKIKKDTTKM